MLLKITMGRRHDRQTKQIVNGRTHTHTTQNIPLNTYAVFSNGKLTGEKIETFRRQRNQLPIFFFYATCFKIWNRYHVQIHTSESRKK